MTYLVRALEQTIDDTEFWGDDGLFPARLERGAADTRIVVVSGPNACGKSFACRYLASAIAAERPETSERGEFFHIGMRLRTSGSGQIGPKTFVYGDESEYSTGAVSMIALNGMLKNSKTRTSQHVIALDEPDIGLSDEYALALGSKIAGFANELPNNCDALIIVSHSRPLISKLMPLKPHCLRFGTLDTAAWLSSPPREATLEELDTLASRNLTGFRAVSKLIAERRRDRG